MHKILIQRLTVQLDRFKTIFFVKMTTPKQSYRTLLKSLKSLFGQDSYQIQQSRIYTRQQFEKNATLTDQQEVQNLLKIASQATIIIQKNIVQGHKKDKDTFVLDLKPHHEINDNQQKQPPQRI